MTMIATPPRSGRTATESAAQSDARFDGLQLRGTQQNRMASMRSWIIVGTIAAGTACAAFIAWFL